MKPAVLVSIVIALTAVQQIARADRELRENAVVFDYKRNGTSTLFAALNTLTGEVIGLLRDARQYILCAYA